MTRRQEIVSASKLYDLHDTRVIGAFGFIEGAEWADRNPAWRNIKDERPNDGEQVLAVVPCDGEQTVWICEYHDCTVWQVFGVTEPIHLWMPLPKIPALAVMD